MPVPSASSDQLSLLWPPGRRTATRTAVSPQVASDLGLDLLVEALVTAEPAPHGRGRRERAVRQALLELSTDAEVIGYRQKTIAELVVDGELRRRLAQALPGLEALADVLAPELFKPSGEPSAQHIAHRLAGLEQFAETSRALERALAPAPQLGPGLAGLRDHLTTLTTSPTFVALEAELPGLRAVLAGARSITVGINLGGDLAPDSATILSINSERVDGKQALLGRLLGGGDGRHGLTPLQRASRGGLAGNPNDVARDLDALLWTVAEPVAQALERYAAFAATPLVRLGPELALLLGGAALVSRLAALGLPMCQPEILPRQARQTELRDGYNVHLALRTARSVEPAPSVVPSDLVFGATRGRVWVLTGPNRSGKTTYTVGAGLAHLLAQAGLFVPARSARLSPVDAIFTHFPSSERARLGMGRLDEEAERLAAIFRQATPDSLILLNEALAGTSSLEALALARDAVRGLRMLGARALYVTHLHELALLVDEINATTPGDALVGSLVAEPPAQRAADVSTDAPPRGFRITPGPPGRWSYASQIAEQHGISFPQLTRLLQERGLAPPPA
ncbi:MAG: hypothetical protein JO023_20685 [Chloroflexi bacterium]|nr:hypothetical protein [Chloroflexota bacterium]